VLDLEDPPSVIDTVSRVVTGDVDGDGDADVVASGFDVDDLVPAIATVEGDGDGGFDDPAVSTGSPGSGTVRSALATGDVDGNGDTEVVYTTGRADPPASAITVLGAPAGFTHPTRNDDQWAGAPVLGDLDGDDRDDLAIHVTGIGFRLFRSTPNGFTGFGPGGEVTQLPSSGAVLHSVAIRDVDGDGKGDLIGTGGSGAQGVLSWWPGRGDGTFGARADRSVDGAGHAIAFGDLGGDARDDVVITHGERPFGQVTTVLNRSVAP
jgi:hypothetical protein